MDTRYPNDPTPYDNSGPEDEAPERKEDTNDQYGTTGEPLVMIPAHQAIYDTLDAALTKGLHPFEAINSTTLSSLEKWNILLGFDGDTRARATLDDFYHIGQFLREKHLTKGTE